MRPMKLAPPFVCLFASLAACGGPPASATETTPTRAAASSVHDSDRGASGASRAGAGGDACALSPVYFEYDSNTLDARSRETLARDATCLRARRDDVVMLTGGTDERGTEEYNFALGDRRARAVEAYLTGAGIETERIRVRSLGEEWASGRDEAGMARDRRVEPSTPAGTR